MPRYQSHLFNWIDRSLPVQLGRRVRKFYEHLAQDRVKSGFETASGFWAEIVERIGNQTAKVFLYPLYALTESAKRIYPQLKSQQVKVPLLLRPFQQLIVWVERTSLAHANRSKSKSDKLFLAVWQQQFPDLDRQISQQTDPQISDRSYEQKRERIHQLIRDAIDYFFGKKSSGKQLDSIDRVESKSEESWLTMADLFGDDSGPWPYPVAHSHKRESDRLSTSSAWDDASLALIQNAQQGGVSIHKPHETSTSHLSRHGIEGEFPPEDETGGRRSRPMQAWIETQATFLGYVYNPIMQFILWLDRLIVALEQWLIHQWQRSEKIFRKIFDRSA